MGYTRAGLSKKIDEKRRELEQLEYDLGVMEAQLAMLTPEQILAEDLHERLCRGNHTDGCGWQYESWGDPGYARKAWLKKAKKVLDAGYEASDVCHILDLID